MDLFDVHNDLLTQKSDVNTHLSKFYKQGLKDVILAIFLSEKKLNINQIMELTSKVSNTYFAVEDVSFIE